MFYKNLSQDTLRGIVLALVYFESTRQADTTLKNIFIFTFFFVIVIYISDFVSIKREVVIGAFMTKTIFTLVDSRINENGEHRLTESKKKSNKQQVKK
jgi:hypothetical protein